MLWGREVFRLQKANKREHFEQLKRSKQKVDSATAVLLTKTKAVCPGKEMRKRLRQKCPNLNIQYKDCCLVDDDYTFSVEGE